MGGAWNEFGTPWWSRSAASMVAVVVVAAASGCLSGCSSSKDNSAPASTSISGTPQTPTPTTTRPGAPASTQSPVSGNGAIFPEALCVDAPNGGRIYFGYSNTGADAVAIPAGPDNSLAGVRPDDAALEPTVLAPGHVTAAFWAYTATPGDAPTWTLAGPDGVVRTATADLSLPECTPDLIGQNGADTRVPVLKFSYTLIPASKTTPPMVDVVAEVTDLAPVSVCPQGLEPQAPVVWTDDGVGGSPVIGPTVTRTLPFEQRRDYRTGKGYSFASTTVAALVVDTCAAGTDITRSWPAGEAFERLRTGALVCISDQGGAMTMQFVDPPSTCGDIPVNTSKRARPAVPLTPDTTSTTIP